MRQRMILILFLLIGIHTHTQNKFEKGYFIQEDGTRIDALIKNDDWSLNPTTFKYKLNKNADVVTGSINSVKEFSVGSNHKYIRYDVNIDRSSKKITELSRKRTPEFKQETLFLRILVDGSSAKLLSYVDNDLRRFFFETGSIKITQLIFKHYRNSKGKEVKNELYQKQLSDYLPCSTISKKPSYHKNSLVEYFVSYNNCNGKDLSLTDFTINENKGKIRIKVKAGVNYSKVDATELGVPFEDPNFSSDHKINPRFGLELEYLIPLNNLRWSLFLEPTYQSFKGDAELLIPGAVTIIRTVPVNYKSIEIPLGVRHYLPLKNEFSKLFINAAFVVDLVIKSTVRNREVRSEDNILLGVGYQQKKISLEIRYNTGRSLNTLANLETSYSGFSINLGYTLF